MNALIHGKVWRLGPYSWVIRPRAVTIGTILGLSIVFLGALAMIPGRLDIGLSDIFAVVSNQSTSDIHRKVILDIRLPRVIAAITVGAALGMSGAIFQSVSRNALGSPDIIGFTTGAATGALVQIVLFDQTPLQVATASIAGGLLTAMVVYLAARRGGTVSSHRLILTGIGAGAVLSALNGILLVKGDLDNATMANMWLAGSLQARTWVHILPVLIGLLTLTPLILLSARQLHMIEMGDDMARQLGIRVEWVRLIMVFYAVMLMALATGTVGPIAFIALAAPQLVMRLNRQAGLPLIGAALMGSCLLLAADTLTQVLPLTAAVPTGRMTGIIGGIYLIWMMTRSRQI